MENIERLQQLCATHSVTGDTSQIKNVITKMLGELDLNFSSDGYGSIIVGNPKKAKAILAAHIDEVGFQVTKINDDGSMSILPVGWVFPNRLDHAPIYIMTDKGTLNGAIFHKSYLKDENISHFSQLFCSIGATTKAEAEKMGVRVGQLGSFRKDFYEQNGTIFATSLDNKVSAFVILELMSKDKEFFEDKLVVFHTDEEMQDHSANSIAFKHHIEYAVILDYCPVHQKFDDEDVLPDFGDGPMIVYRGGNHIVHEDIRKKLHGLPYFKSFISNNTLPGLEPDNFQNNGTTKALNLCVPSIGYHGPVYAILKKDIELFEKSIIDVCKALVN